MKILFTPIIEELSNYPDDLTPYEYLSLFTFVNIDFNPDTIDEQICFDTLPPDEIVKFCKNFKLNKKYFQKAVDKGLFDNLSDKEVLFRCIEGGSLFHVKDALTGGANLDMTDLGEALLLASECGHHDIVTYLISRGADVNYKDKTYGWTPLLKASFMGHTETAKLLIENGADIHATNRIGGILLNSINHFDTFRYLVSLGIDLNKDFSLLYATALGMMIEIIHLLVDSGADINIQDENGGSALLIAYFNNDLSLMKYFIDHGADVNLLFDNGNTILIFASKNGNLNAVKLLVENGADVTIENKNGKTALMYAIKNNHVDITGYLNGYSAM